MASQTTYRSTGAPRHAWIHPGASVPRCVVLSFLLLACASSAGAQIRAGVHYAALSLEYPDQTRHGAGGFLVYSPRDWMGLDVATSVFPSDSVGETAWQFVAGPRVGRSFGRIGVFGRIRPGFVRFSERFIAPDTGCIAIFPTPESCLVKSTSVALDYGATVEALLSPRTLIRFDIGDALTRYRRGDDSPAWKHGVQFVAGAGWSF